MNQQRKDAIAAVAVKIDGLTQEIQSIIDADSEARDNMKDETAIERSESATEAMDSAITSLQEAEQMLGDIE